MDIEDAVDRLMSRYYFEPGVRYQLKRQVRHTGRTRKQVAKKRQDFLEQPGDSLKRRDSQWQNVPGAYVNLPYQPASRRKTGIEDLKDKEDFFEWFENMFSGLKDGVYTAYKGGGYGNGFKYFFILKFENGDVVDWRKKSSGTPYRNPSTYYGFPYYFRLRKKWNV